MVLLGAVRPIVVTFTPGTEPVGVLDIDARISFARLDEPGLVGDRPRQGVGPPGVPGGGAAPLGRGGPGPEWGVDGMYGFADGGA